MAYTISLTDGTTTLALNDASNYKVQEGGLHLPTPALKPISAGRPEDALFPAPPMDDAESQYHYRHVTVGLHILGTSDDDLTTNVRAINDLLRKGMDYTRYGMGAQLELQLKLDAGTTTLKFKVLSGELRLPDNWLNTPALDKNSRIGMASSPATLTLTCKPFARGAQVTLDNYLDNPGFELGDGGNPLHNWTATNSTNSQDTTATVPEGTYWGKNLSNCAGGQQGSFAQSITWSNSYRSATWYLRLKYQCPAANDREQRVTIYDGVDTTTSAVLTKDGTTITLNMSHTFNAAATEGTIRVYSNYVAGADTNDYILVDECYFGPNDPSGHSLWISGNDITNRNDPDNLNDATDINYVDILNVGGDVPGELKLYIVEGQAETRLVVAGRHGSEYDDAIYLEHSGAADAALSNADYAERIGDDSGAGAGTWPQTGSGSDVPSGITGLFRVFARMNRQNASNSQFAVTYRYGNLTPTPASTDYIDSVANYNWYDLGTVTIPPIAAPSGETEPTFYVFLYVVQTGAAVIWRVDAMILFPIRPNEGYVVADHSSATKQLLYDSESGVYVMTTADVLDGAPTALIGTPCAVDPSSSRFHILAPGTAPLTDTFTVSAKVTPRYLHL